VSNLAKNPDAPDVGQTAEADWTYTVMSPAELRSWADNELDMSGDDENNGEVAVARSVLFIVRRLEFLESATRPF
jgi:hypothetical protein